MSYDPDFGLMLQGYSLVTVSVLYYIPDHKFILNEFMWQTLDLKPKYPRVERFLEFWKKEIDAVIKEVRLADSLGFGRKMINATEIIPMHFQ